MSQIQTGRYADLLRRTLGMKGVTEVAAELAPEISPVFILEAELPEWEFLKGQKLMSSVFAVGGNVGQNSVYRLRNPTGSGVVGILTEFLVTVETFSVVIIERDIDRGNLATVLPTVARDSRLPVLDASALIPSNGNNIVLTGESWWSDRILADLGQREPTKFVLTPGNQIDVATISDNIGIRGWFHWRERRLDVLEEA